MDSSDDFDESQFTFIGDFSPPDTRRLFAALAEARIEFRAKFYDGIVREAGSLHRGFGMDAHIEVFVDSEKLPEAEKIQRNLFGDFTP